MDDNQGKRRQSRSQSIVSATRRRKSLGAFRYADNDLTNVNENEINSRWISPKVLYSINDEEDTSINNFNDTAKSRSKSVPRVTSPTSELQTQF